MYHDRQIANGPFFQSVSPSPSPFPSLAAPQTRTLIDLRQDWLHLLRLDPLRVPCRAPVFRACISYCIFNESFNCASSTSSLSSSEASEAPDSFDAAVCTPQMILLVSGAFLTSRDAATCFLARSSCSLLANPGLRALRRVLVAPTPQQLLPRITVHEPDIYSQRACWLLSTSTTASHPHSAQIRQHPASQINLREHYTLHMRS